MPQPMMPSPFTPQLVGGMTPPDPARVTAENMNWEMYKQAFSLLMDIEKMEKSGTSPLPGQREHVEQMMGEFLRRATEQDTLRMQGPSVNPFMPMAEKQSLGALPLGQHSYPTIPPLQEDFS